MTMASDFKVWILIRCGVPMDSVLAPLPSALNTDDTIITSVLLGAGKRHLAALYLLSV